MALSAPISVNAIPPATVTVADPTTEESLTDVAVIVTARSAAGRASGAVYVVAIALPVEDGETVPQGAVGQDTVQLTPRPAVSLLTTAVTCAVAPG
jgi:hypothetical protein